MVRLNQVQVACLDDPGDGTRGIVVERVMGDGLLYAVALADGEVRHYRPGEVVAPDRGGYSPGAVALALAEAGFRGPITERSLRQLTRWAHDYGLSWVVEQVQEDPSLTWIATADVACGAPSWFFLSYLEARREQAASDFMPWSRS